MQADERRRGLEAELARLRRHAFTRHATPRDHRRLEELERELDPSAADPPAAQEAPEHGRGFESAAEPSGDVEPPAEPEARRPLDAPPEPPRPRSRHRLVLGGLILVAAGLVGAAVSAAIAASAPRSSLEVFISPPGTIPDGVVEALPLSALPGAQWRHLGDVDGRHIVAMLQGADEEKAICLFAERDGRSVGDCADWHAFQDDGLKITIGEFDETTEIRWGPTGGIRTVQVHP